LAHYYFAVLSKSGAALIICRAPAQDNDYGKTLQNPNCLPRASTGQ
jgi:hypothetical protein